ncbi:Copper amine oxidase 1 [Cladobotryum mycophilum]|uniref:Amine oxidase n=1 Tax=Cladobotryum mycophilum TaxID=491253 RepID=A0ABR0SGF4_9HYPO
MATLPHPLAPLSEAEVHSARDAAIKSHDPSESLYFRSIYLQEPKKSLLLPFLEAEHAGTLTAETPRPPRQATAEYSIVNGDLFQHVNAVVDVVSGEVTSKDVAPAHGQPYFSPHEFSLIEEACLESEIFKEAMSEFTLPEGFELTLDGKKSVDSNHYAFPIPLIPVMDWKTKEVIRVERLPTGGSGDSIHVEARKDTPKKLFENARTAEYLPEFLDIPLRTDLKPINITQPEGTSFNIHSDGLVEWQKWRFRLGITPREGAVLHDVCYDGRPILYRLSYSEMTVPYADPRPPFQRKQAFDFGDGGIGRAANNLELGCDCLGAIHYVDTLGTQHDGSASLSKAVVCIHEQDNGILWKHTNYRTNRAAVTRNREFVVQFIATLANYEYIFAYKLDLAGGITMETRATGVVSVVSIDEGKTSTYGNIVSPGILAQNHQHIFAARIDPAIDSYKEGESRVVVEESVSRKIDPETNPYGNLYEVERKPVEKPTWIDAEPRLNRLLKIENSSKKNEISGKNVGYKLVSPVTQLLLADNDGLAAQRARYAQHHFWVTGYRDGELWAAGEYTNQSNREVGGVSDMIKRPDWFPVDPLQETNDGDKSSPVIWSVFGLTHNVRVEDWPVMPMESHMMHLRPADFFTFNPALDVPPAKNAASVLVSCCGGSTKDDTVQENPSTHLQGSGEGVSAEAAGAHVDGSGPKSLTETILGLVMRS